MLEEQGPRTESRAKSVRFALESQRPLGVVLDEHDRAVVARPLVDRHSGQDARTGLYSPGQSLYATRGASVSSGADAP